MTTKNKVKRAKHTPGFLQTDAIFCVVSAETLYPVAEVFDGKGGGGTQEDRKANERRVIDCWNACEGIEDPKELRDQRDALLAAAERAAPFLAVPDGEMPSGPLAERKALDGLRAAIARARGMGE